MLVCQIQRKVVEGLAETQSRSSGVNYTLLVYTDQEGGCLLFEENITGPCEFTTAVPLRYGKIFLRLIGSVVGVDGKSTTLFATFANENICRCDGDIWKQ